MKITAAVLRQLHAPFTLEEIDLAEPTADEVLVRISAVGLCHTDMAVQEGSLPVSLPAVIGHEGAGVVERVGSAVTKVKPGDKVVLSFPFCGGCTNCTRGDVSYCEKAAALFYGGRREDGTPTLVDANGAAMTGHFFGQSSLATYALANQKNTIPVPSDTSLTLAAPLGCGVQTGAGAVMRSLRAEAGRSIAIYGGGSVGLSAVLGAAIRGCGPIIVIEPVAARRALALEIGATHAIDPKAGDLVEQIKAITSRGTDYAVDTTGVVAVVKSAMGALAPHGAMAWLGVPRNAEAELGLSMLGFLASGATLKAVIEGDSVPDTFIPELLAHHRAGRLPLEKLVSTFPFAQINEAFAAQKAGTTLKAVLTF